jgi:membrane protein
MRSEGASFDPENARTRSATLVLVVGKFLLGLYIGKAAIGSAYGAAGSFIVILIWVYWSAQILFFGAELTQVYARSHGSRVGDAMQALKKLVV